MREVSLDCTRTPISPCMRGSVDADSLWHPPGKTPASASTTIATAFNCQDLPGIEARLICLLIRKLLPRIRPGQAFAARGGPARFHRRGEPGAHVRADDPLALLSG